MDTFILRIQRQSGGICGIGLATEVTIDGGNKRTFKAGDIQEYYWRSIRNQASW